MGYATVPGTTQIENLGATGSASAIGPQTEHWQSQLHPNVVDIGGFPTME
jgi:hypothetical protein